MTQDEANHMTLTIARNTLRDERADAQRTAWALDAIAAIESGDREAAIRIGLIQPSTERTEA